MEAFHLTNNLFNKFNTDYCRCSSFGAGFYFYTEEHDKGNSRYQLSCNVTLKHPMIAGKQIIPNDKWEEVRQYLIDVVKKATNKEVTFFPFGGDNDIISYKYFCQFIEDYIDKPNWKKIFRKFISITGCDGYKQDDFIISFNANHIIINK